MIRCPVCDQNVNELTPDGFGYDWCNACDFALEAYSPSEMMIKKMLTRPEIVFLEKLLCTASIKKANGL
jgi:hypothetical protein